MGRRAEEPWCFFPFTRLIFFPFFSISLFQPFFGFLFRKNTHLHWEGERFPPLSHPFLHYRLRKYPG